MIRHLLLNFLKVKKIRPASVNFSRYTPIGELDNMSSTTVLVLLGFITLIILSGVHSSSGEFINDAKDEFDDKCGSTTSFVPAMGKCVMDLDKDLGQQHNSSALATNKKFGQTQNYEHPKIPELDLCYALTKFEDCILKDVKLYCGKNAQEQMKEVVPAIVKQLKFIYDQTSGVVDNTDCEWEDNVKSDQDKENGKTSSDSSATCWSIHGQVIGGFALVTLTICCCGFCFYYYHRNGKIQTGQALIHYASELPLIGTARQSEGITYHHLSESHTD